MLQMEGQTVTNGGAKSPERRKRYAANERRKPRRKGENVIWRRIKDNIDDLVIKTGTNPAIASVVSRLVLFGHLTVEEGEVARFYGERMRRYARFFGELPHTVRAQDINASRGGIDEIALHTAGGSLREYEKRARQAKKQHDRIEKVLQPFLHGRDVLDDLCMNDSEINASHYPVVRQMLALVAVEFGLKQGQGKAPARAPSKGDIKMVAEAAAETLANAAKRHKIAVRHFDVKGADKTTRTLYVFGSEPGESLCVKLKLYKALPEAMTAALFKACEAKGWKAVV